MTSTRRGSPTDETASLGPTKHDWPLALVVTTPDGTFTRALPPRGTLRIGRSDDCEIPIREDAVSRVHALVHVDRSVTIEDARSRNGTVVHGTRVEPGERHLLPESAVIEIGNAVLVLVRQPRGSSAVDESSTGSVVVASEAMRELMATASELAASPLPILILGETGSGKEVVARTVHERSPRARGPFVAVNCAAIPESILESELFGHTKGAFTGAMQAKIGLFEAADRGTLFLDEVGELSPTTQAKLLRVLETGEVTPLGSVRPKRVDARIVAATNRDLRALVSAGRFREDLFFRLDGATVHVPPLRERKADMAPLVESFARRAAARLGRAAPRFDDAAMAAMENHDWPGNVRELRSVVERAVTLGRGAPVLGAGQLRLRSTVSPQGGPSILPPSASSLPDERQRIVDALARASGNQTIAAKLLGFSRQTLIRRMEQFGIGRPRKGAPT